MNTPDPASVLLLDFLHQTYKQLRLNLTPESVAQMVVTVGRFSGFLRHPATIADLTAEAVRGFLSDYRAAWSAASTNSKRCHLLALWRAGSDEGLLPTPPNSRKIPRAKGTPTIPEAWTAEEVGRIFQEAEREPGSIAGIPAAAWWKSVLLVAYDTAERRGAISAVTPADLSLEAGSIMFRKTKTGIPRWCALSPETIEACRVIYDPGRELLWPWPYSRETMGIRFKRILKAAGVAYGRGRGGLFHKIRRTAGTLVEVNGGDGAKFLGNSRAVFIRNYRDPRFLTTDLSRLPRPPRQESEKPPRQPHDRQGGIEEAFRNEALDTEGSLWRFFHSVYVPEAMPNCKAVSIEQHETAIRRFCRFAKRSVLVAELTDQLVGTYLRWMVVDYGGASKTADSTANVIVAEFRYARVKGLVKRGPNLDKIKSYRDHGARPGLWRRLLSRLTTAANL